MVYGNSWTTSNQERKEAGDLESDRCSSTTPNRLSKMQNYA